MVRHHIMGVLLLLSLVSVAGCKGDDAEEVVGPKSGAGEAPEVTPQSEALDRMLENFKKSHEARKKKNEERVRRDAATAAAYPDYVEMTRALDGATAANIEQVNKGWPGRVIRFDATVKDVEKTWDEREKSHPFMVDVDTDNGYHALMSIYLADRALAARLKKGAPYVFTVKVEALQELRIRGEKSLFQMVGTCTAAEPEPGS